MFTYIVRRVLAIIPVMGVVALFVFSLLYITPGDPAVVIAGDLATLDDIARIRKNLGLDEPFLFRFVSWLWGVLQGDLGISIFTNLPVSRLIGQRLEATAALTICTLIVSVCIAVPLGVVAAWKVGTWIDRAVMAFAVLGFSVPIFVLAYVLILIFSLWLELLPVQGYASITQGFWPFLERLILPSFALGMVYVALIARITRASMLEVLSQDYVRTAHAKGLATDKVLIGHALRNAAIPIVTIIGIGVALLISGVVVTETVFAIPGIGRLTVDAILRRDYPIIQGVILLFSAAYVLVNLAVDISYTFLDPRIRVLIMATLQQDFAPALPTARRLSKTRDFVRRNPTMVAGLVLLLAMVGMAVFAPYLGTVDPQALAPIRRLRPPSEQFWFGTDMLGRDVYSRVVYGARISLAVGLCVALLSTLTGLALGLVTGYSRPIDAIVMRFMDGLMSIPPILLAIALMALTKASLENVIIAITIAEVPRVTRLVRGVVLSLREQPFVEAAVACGTGFFKTLVRHILPNTMAPLIVQGTFICASAIITEAILSFIGAGTPPNIPSWGNIMAEGRALFQVAYYVILFPGICLSLAVLAVNLVGDGLRDMLDPRLARSM